jgi:hypothetical protein
MSISAKCYKTKARWQNKWSFLAKPTDRLQGDKGRFLRRDLAEDEKSN